jgi:hypothetical protein
LAKRRITFPEFLALGVASVAAVLLFFWVGAGFQTDWSKLAETIGWLFRENNDLIPKDNHLLVNPALLAVGTIAGIGLPATAIAAWGAWHSFKKGHHRGLKILILFVLFEFLILWKLDAPFIRRCLIFLPFASLLCGYGVEYFLRKNLAGGRLIILAGLFYTLALTAASQWNFVKDTRFQSEAYLNTLDLKDKRVFRDAYANLYGQKSSTNPDSADYIVIHESYYRRYWKSFTTPFKVPKCCEEVYHCGRKKSCEFIQSVLAGKTDFVLLKNFEPVDWAPERLLYKKYLGTYETFLGDVLIFKKPERQL